MRDQYQQTNQYSIHRIPCFMSDGVWKVSFIVSNWNMEEDIYCRLFDRVSEVLRRNSPSRPLYSPVLVPPDFICFNHKNTS